MLQKQKLWFLEKGKFFPSLKKVPLYLNIIPRYEYVSTISSVWPCKLIVNENKLSSVLYRLMYLLKTKHQHSFKWLNHIESIFNSTGMGFIFINQFPVYNKSVFNQILRDQFVHKPSSPYIIKYGVVFLTFKIRFQNFNWICSITF
jgi:hypothetical protein